MTCPHCGADLVVLGGRETRHGDQTTGKRFPLRTRHEMWICRACDLQLAAAWPLEPEAS